jgi:hypothetical protein
MLLKRPAFGDYTKGLTSSFTEKGRRHMLVHSNGCCVRISIQLNGGWEGSYRAKGLAVGGDDVYLGGGQSGCEGGTKAVEVRLTYGIYLRTSVREPF